MTIIRISEHYSKPIFERIWFVVGLLATIIVPAALYNTILHNMGFQDDFINDVQDFDIFIRARALTGAISLAIILIFTVPMLIWKFIGRRHVTRSLQQWARSDNTLAGNSGMIPTWRVRTPGIFSDNTILTITLPSSLSPSSFHPNAYLPSYVNPPEDAGDTYFYPYKSHQPGLPRMSVVGNVPLYTDEKYDFQDVKV